MPGLLLGFDRAIGLVQRRLPLAEILLLRQPARGAQLIEHRRIGRALVEECGVELPQRAVGGVVEDQPLVGAEDRDAGRELVERAPVRVDHAGLSSARMVSGFGRVDADAGAAAAGRERRARRRCGGCPQRWPEAGRR